MLVTMFALHATLVHYYDFEFNIFSKQLEYPGSSGFIEPETLKSDWKVKLIDFEAQENFYLDY